VYTILVSDNNGCTAEASASIAEPAAILTSMAATNALCNGSADGTATVTVLGGISPYTYAWSAGTSVLETAGNLSAGTYTVTVTDGNGCTVAAPTIVSEPAPISIADAITNITCNGYDDGTLLLTTSGGTAPFSYSWSSPVL